MQIKSISVRIFLTLLWRGKLEYYLYNIGAFFQLPTDLFKAMEYFIRAKYIYAENNHPDLKSVDISIRDLNGIKKVE